MKVSTTRVRVLLVVLVLLGTFVGSQVQSKPALAASCSVRLTPREIPGPWYQEHRHYLEAPRQIRRAYTILNLTTNEAFKWDNWGVFGNTTRFGVPTRYTVLHSGWKSYYWLLAYEC